MDVPLLGRHDVKPLARRRTFGRLAWAAVFAALVSALLAVWLWDQRWIATAGVLLFAALVFSGGATT